MMFHGPWTTWKEVDPSNCEALWQRFKETYQWEAKYTDSVMHGVWKKAIAKRFPDTMTRARKESIELAKAKNVNVSLTGDLSRLKPFRPTWIKEIYWVDMIDRVWNTDKWKRKSESGKNNRNKMELGSISKHCCGSIPVSHHRDLLESNLKRPPTRLELFEQTHRTKKPKEGTSNTEYITPKVGMVMNAYKDGMVTKYGDDSDSHPPYDHDLWLEVTGGIKKGRVLGFGSVSDPQSFLVPSLAAPSTTPNNLEVIVDQVREEMKEELKVEREKMKEELKAEREKMKEERKAEREEIEAQKQEIAKMYHEMKKLKG